AGGAIGFLLSRSQSRSALPHRVRIHNESLDPGTPVLKGWSAFCDASHQDSARQRHLKQWGGRWESNPQRPEPQSGALPVELLPPHLLIITSALQVRLEREVFGLQIQRMGNVDFRIKEQISDSRFHISLRKRGQLKMCSLQSSF